MVYRPSLHGQSSFQKASPSINQSGSDFDYRSYYDGYRRKAAPSDENLIRENKRIIYTCASINVNKVLGTPLRLYMKRESKLQKTLLRKGIETREVSRDRLEKLYKWQSLDKTLRRAIDIEEVLIHPILDLLQKANHLPYFNGNRLVELGQWYQEIVGREYWLIENHPVLGFPIGIWLLPSHRVTPISEKSTLDYYEYRVPGQAVPKKYQPEDVISYLMPSLTNPYIGGYSPLMACYDLNEMTSKQISLETNLLDNEGRPDIILSPKQDSAIGPDEARRFEREYRTRFARGRTGGIWVMEEPLDHAVLNFNPKDMARLDLHKIGKNEIGNAYSVPYALISDASHNREQLEACETQHAKTAIVPRLNRRMASLNDPEHGLVARFDESGLLFLAYDDPVPENEENKINKISRFVQDAVWTRNEARKYDGTYGESADPIADKLMPMNVPSEPQRSNSRGTEKNPKKPAK